MSMQSTQNALLMLSLHGALGVELGCFALVSSQSRCIAICCI